MKGVYNKGSGSEQSKGRKKIVKVYKKPDKSLKFGVLIVGGFLRWFCLLVLLW